MNYQPFWWEGCHLVLAQADKQPEIAWWIVPLFSALLAVFGAVAGSWMAISSDRKKAVNQELVKKRLDLYSTYVPLANDLFCFLRKVGNFRSMTPASILDAKRKLDQFRYLYGPLFTGSGVVDAYDTYIKLCFNEFKGNGQPACIRADPVSLARQYGSSWQTSWDSGFDTDHIPADGEIDQAYSAFVDAFAQQVGARR
jgi:hypothetical protein